MLYSELSSPASAKSQKGGGIVKVPCDWGAEEVVLATIRILFFFFFISQIMVEWSRLTSNIATLTSKFSLVCFGKASKRWRDWKMDPLWCRSSNYWLSVLFDSLDQKGMSTSKGWCHPAKEHEFLLFIPAIEGWDKWSSCTFGFALLKDQFVWS